MNSKTINSFSARTVGRLMSARRAVLTMLATFLIAMTAHTAWAQDPATIGSISYNETLEAYEINSVDNLNDLAVYVNGSGNYSTNGSETTPHDCQGLTFKMTADITFNTTVDNNFTPIGEQNKNFYGTFDGQGHTISGIRINKPSDDYIGIFGALGSTTAGVVKNLVVRNCSIVGDAYVGVIAGDLTGGAPGAGIIENCHVGSDVTLSGNSYVGGIAGISYKGRIVGCTCAATITGTNSGGYDATKLGGITGRTHSSDPSTLTNNLFTGAITGVLNNYIGAIVGEKQSGTLTNNVYTSTEFKGIGKGNSIEGDDADGETKHAYSITEGAYVTVDFAGDATTKYSPNGISVYDAGMKYANALYVGGTEAVSLLLSKKTDYPLLRYSATTGTLSGTAITGNKDAYTLTMAEPASTITANIAFWGEKNGADGSSEEKAYVITGTEGLDLLAQSVNAGNTYEGKYFKLGDNIAYDKDNNFTPIGCRIIEENNQAIECPFRGHFDGNGKTISGINLNNSDVDDHGIFGYLYGTVKNLVVSNCSIVADHNIGAIVGVSFGTIENCHVGSDVTLSGHSHVGGIAGWCATATIKGCTSAATITGTNSSGDNANNLGGIVGATNGPSSSLTDNLFTGAITGDLGQYIGAIFGWGNEYATLTNNVYTSAGFGGIGAEGSATGADGAGARKAVVIGAAEGVTITPTGEATTYNVSGITTYADNNVLGYDSKLYAGATDAVKLSIVNTGTPETGYEFSGFTAGEGVTITSSENVYTLTVPASDVTVDVVYQAIIYNITYKGVEDEGVTFTEDNPEAYTVETESFALNNPSREGYLFTGWTYEGQDEPTKTVTIAMGSTGDKTFTANWKRFLTDEGITVSTIADQTFTGSAITPAITVMDGTTDISDQCDFAYSDNVDVGTATVVISAKESSTAYAGERSMTFNIISDVKAWGDGDGISEATPYVISSTEGLDLLAQKVNDGNSYAGKYFKIGADITYTHLADGAEGAGEENNYTAIGNSDFAFQGHFDGGGKTISGIRIYNENMGYQGLFGQIAAPGEVKNVILADTRIVAGEKTGCIAGYNAGTLKDNFVIGTTISSVSDTYVGAIAGQNENGTLTGNYYAACTAGSTAKATGIGCNGADVIANDGALSVHQITFAAVVTGVAIDAAAKAYSYNSKDYYAQGKPVKLTYSGTPDTGYEFSGFTAGEGVTITSSENVYTLTVPASDVTVDVVYDPILYTITYKGVEDEGVTFTEDNPEAYTVETESFALNNPSREGYLFTGWTYEGQDEPTKTVTIAMGSTGDKTFTANWEEFVETEVETAVTNEAAKEVEITKVMVPKGETKAVIPATVNGYTVTNIAKGAFYYKTGEDHVQDIILPDTKRLINIEEDALIFDKLMEPTLHVPLGLLSDYANMPGLKIFFEADKIQAMAVAVDKYWTFSCGIDVKVPEGVKVYTCRMNDDKTAVVIHELTDDELGGVIKANNGVLLSSATGEYPFVVNHASATEVGKSYENNLLEPVLRAKNYASGEYYVLKDNEFHPILANDSKVPACKAVLKKPTGVSGSRTIGIDEDDDATRIWGVSVADEDAVWYTVSGQRIDKPTKKGLYIKNGKKVIIK